MKSKIDSRPKSCSNQVTTLQLTEWETGEVVNVFSNEGLIKANKQTNIILIEYPSKAENQCFSYPLSLKSKWTCSLVPNILGKFSSIDTVEFSFFLALYEAMCLHLLYHPSVPNIKQALLLYFEEDTNISIELIKFFSNEVAITYLAFIVLL